MANADIDDATATFISAQPSALLARPELFLTLDVMGQQDNQFRWRDGTFLKTVSYLSQLHHFGRTAFVYIAHASSLWLRSAGAHFVRRPVGLASARSMLRVGVYHWCYSGSENGVKHEVLSKAVRPE